MITDIFDAISDIVQGVIGVFVDLFADNGLIAIFYDSTAEELTLVGILVLLLFGFGLVKWGFNWVKNLLSMKR